MGIDFPSSWCVWAAPNRFKPVGIPMLDPAVAPGVNADEA